MQVFLIFFLLFHFYFRIFTKNSIMIMDILELVESFGLCPVKTGRNEYSTKEHNSLVLRVGGRYDNTFFWNSKGIGGGVRKLYELLTQDGYVCSGKVRFEKRNFEHEYKEVDKRVYTYDNNLVNSTLVYRDEFSQSLIRTFGKERAKNGLKKYHVGTSKAFKGNATVFWTCDHLGRFGMSKVIQYQGLSRRKDGNYANWVHNLHNKGIDKESIINPKFGQHLLHKYDTFVIVESEKTAILLSCFIDDIGFIALGGQNKQGITDIGNGKKFYLVPDVSEGNKIFNDWRTFFIGWQNIKVLEIEKILGEALPDKYDLGDAILDGKKIDLSQDRLESLCGINKTEVKKLVYKSPKKNLSEKPQPEKLLDKFPILGSFCQKFSLENVETETFDYHENPKDTEDVLSVRHDCPF